MIMNSTQIIVKMDSLWAIRDPRVEGWLLMDSPKPMMMLIVLYLLMVFVGPIIMKNKKPLNVTGLMIAYNLFIVVLSIYIVSQFLIGVIRLKYNWLCDSCNPLATDEETMRIVGTVHLYLLTKPLEWLDTFFFIIRKKNRQLTFLHVYHHCSILPFAWIFARWVPSGNTFFTQFLNTFVHVIMYTYYILSAFGPAIQKYLWWKKYLTLLQLAQFILAISHSIGQIHIGCDYPLFLQLFAVVYVLIFLILFFLFYKSTYKKDVKQSQDLHKTTETNEISITKERVSNVVESVQLNLLSKENLRQRNMVVGF